MNTMERKYVYTLRQYKREGFGHSYNFVDGYENTRLMNSIMTRQVLSDDELGRFFNVFISHLHKGDNAEFRDSTERKMNKLFSENKHVISGIEQMLVSKKGREWFDTYYEKTCYFLAFALGDDGGEAYETFHISQTYSPLMCLKMAYQLGEAQSTPYRILLSDRCTEVDPELLAFAISEK